MTRIALIVACATLTLNGMLTAQSEPVDFDGAQWIWHPFELGMTLGSLPASVHFFRGTVMLPENTAVEAAELIITADNLFALYLNGHSVGESGVDNSAWQRPKRSSTGTSRVCNAWPSMDLISGARCLPNQEL